MIKLKHYYSFFEHNIKCFYQFERLVWIEFLNS